MQNMPASYASFFSSLFGSQPNPIQAIPLQPLFVQLSQPNQIGPAPKAYNDNSRIIVDFNKLYSRIDNAVKTTSYGCFLEHLIKTGQVFSQICSDAAKCSSRSCYKGLIDQLNTHFADVDKRIEGYRCMDMVFSPILLDAKQMLTMDESSLIDGIKSFGVSLKTTSSPVSVPVPSVPAPSETGFIQLYNDATDAINTKKYGCFEDLLRGIEKVLANARSNASGCSDFDNQCYNTIILTFKRHVDYVSNQIVGVRCFDMGVSPIIISARRLVANPDSTLVSYLKDFARTNPKAPIVPVAPVISAKPEIFFKEKQTGFIQLYIDATEAINAKKYGCAEDQLSSVQKVMANARSDASACAKTDNTCYNQVLQITTDGLIDVSKKASGSECRDPGFSPILFSLRQLLFRGRDVLLEFLKDLVNTAPTVSAPASLAVLAPSAPVSVAPPAVAPLAVAPLAVAPSAVAPLAVAPATSSNGKSRILAVNFVRIYEMLRGNGKTGCSGLYMTSSQQMLENVHQDAAKCFQFTKRAQSYNCFKSILPQNFRSL